MQVYAYVKMQKKWKNSVTVYNNHNASTQRTHTDRMHNSSLIFSSPASQFSWPLGTKVDGLQMIINLNKRQMNFGKLNFNFFHHVFSGKKMSKDREQQENEEDGVKNRAFTSLPHT